MNKNLPKAIMLRTKLRNKFLKNRSNENKTNYVKQQNHCVSLLRKTKSEYYSNLDEKSICDSKTFWKIVKPMLSMKIKSNERICLIENDEIIKTENGTAKALNAFFSNIVLNLDIQQYNEDNPTCENINDPLLKAIFRYRNHPGIVAIMKLSYLKNRMQRTKINPEYSSWEEIMLGVPQGSISGPLLFDMFLCDLFLIMENIDIVCYADDNTPYTTGNSIEEVIQN